VDQAVAIRACLAMLRSEFTDGVVGLGQPGEAQERQRRLALVLGLAGFVDVYLAAGANNDGLVRLVQGEHVQEVALGFGLCMLRPRQVELPSASLLALAVMRGQAQVLAARAHRIVVMVGGVMADRESHATSR